METQGGRRGRPPYPDILTPAEWHVLEQLRKGLTNAEIAVELGISPDGVKYHVSNMLAKLDLPDRHALAQWKPPRTGIRSRLSTRGLIAGTLGFCGVAAAAIGIAAGTGVFDSGAAVSPNLPAVRSTLAITTYELTETSYTAPELLQPPVTAGQSSIASVALSDGIHQTVHVYFQAPDKSRTEKPNNDPDGLSVELIDGGNILNWLSGTGTVMETADPFGRTDLASTNEAGRPADGTTLAALMNTLANGAKVTLAGRDVVAGRPVYVIDVGAAPCPSGVPWLDGTKRYWLDKQTLFVLKAEQYTTGDHQVASSSEVTSITYNQPLDSSLFAPPPGAKVENMNPFGSCGSIPPTPTPDASGVTGPQTHVISSQCGSAVQFQSMGSDAAGGCPTPGSLPTAMNPYALLTAVSGNAYSSSTTVAIMGH